jgi:hypothetical protein
MRSSVCQYQNLTQACRAERERRFLLVDRAGAERAVIGELPRATILRTRRKNLGEIAVCEIPALGYRRSSDKR